MIDVRRVRDSLAKWFVARNGAADWLGGVIPLVKPLLYVGAICAWLTSLSSTIPFTGSIAWLIGLVLLVGIRAANVERLWWHILLIQMQFEGARRVITIIPIFNVCVFLAKLLSLFIKQLKHTLPKPLLCRPAVQTSAPNYCECNMTRGEALIETFS